MHTYTYLYIHTYITSAPPHLSTPATTNPYTRTCQLDNHPLFRFKATVAVRLSDNRQKTTMPTVTIGVHTDQLVLPAIREAALFIYASVFVSVVGAPASIASIEVYDLPADLGCILGRRGRYHEASLY
jgi:hypothetical protein